MKFIILEIRVPFILKILNDKHLRAILIYGNALVSSHPVTTSKYY